MTESGKYVTLSQLAYTDFEGFDIARLANAGWSPGNGLVQLRGNSVSAGDIAWLKDVRGVLFVDRGVSAEDIEALGGIESIRILMFTRCRFEDNFQWSAISRLPCKYIGIGGCNLSALKVEEFLRSIPEGICCVDLADTAVDDSLSSLLSRLSYLEYLGITQNTVMTDIGFKKVCGIASLRTIDVAEFSTRISRDSKNQVRLEIPILQVNEM